MPVRLMDKLQYLPTSASATSVDVTLIAGSATSGSDFTFTPITVTFPASSTSPQNVSFSIIDDILYEGLKILH